MWWLRAIKWGRLALNVLKGLSFIKKARDWWKRRKNGLDNENQKGSVD